MDEQTNGPAVPAVVESFVKQLYITAKAVRLYPAASSIPQERAAALRAVLKAAQERLPAVVLRFNAAGMFWEDSQVFRGKDAYVEFGREFYARNVDQVRFHVGASEQELLDFLGVLLMTPGELAHAGGFVQRLWDLGVNGVTVEEIAVRVIDATEGEDGAALEALAADALVVLPDTQGLDDMLLTDHRPTGGERVLLLVAADTAAVTAYLTASSLRDMPADALVAARLAGLARSVETDAPPADRGTLMRSLAQALYDIAPDARRTVLAERVIPGARRDPVLSDVLRAATTDEIAEAIVGPSADAGARDADLAIEPGAPDAGGSAGSAGGAPQASGDESSAVSDEQTAAAERARVVRVIRTLLHLGLHDGREIRDSFARALLRRGTDPNAVASVLADAEQPIPSAVAPTPVPLAGPGEPTVADEVIARVTPEQLQELGEQARAGITDGDIFRTLVSLAVIVRSDDEFDSLAAMLEDGIGTLIQGHYFGSAAEASDMLETAATDDAHTPEQRKRLSELLDRMMSRESIGSVAAAMRLYPPESSEHDACRQLLDRFAARGIDTMLDAMADEQDMVARKALVDALSENASAYVTALSQRVSDPRWYVVRNLVTVLGAAHDPQSVDALARTLRYPDPRVRRETIRALGRIPDDRAAQLLVAALDDSDAANVQLVIRSLGQKRYMPALPALHAVALGDGKGNSEIGPRAEAVEALGRLGAPESLPVLESLRRFRGLRALRRNRELVPAADRAIAAIQARRALGDGQGGQGS